MALKVLVYVAPATSAWKAHHVNIGWRLDQAPFPGLRIPDVSDNVALTCCQVLNEKASI